jgi:formylmethanofuran dehydrogenase subunit E
MDDDKALKAVPDWLVEFHGHLCPFLVVGWRMGQEALGRLGVERERDQGLFLFTELGGEALRAQSCFEDGLQAATGCTAGKGTLRRLNFGKVASVLVQPGGKAVRAALRPEICDELAQTDYAEQRRQGKPASAVSAAAIADAVGRVARLRASELFSIAPVSGVDVRPQVANPARARCANCDEYVFEQDALVRDGRVLCRTCAGQPAAAWSPHPIAGQATGDA